MTIPALGRRGEGWFAFQVVFMLAIAVAGWASDPSSGAGTTGAATLPVLGGFGLLASVLLLGLGSIELRRATAFSALPRPVETGSLVESGPYRFVRHPIYSALILGGFSIALLRISPLAAVMTVALAAILDLKRRREELWLIDRYPGYAAYRARTRALVPFLY